MENSHLPSLERIRNLLWQVWKERNNFVFRGTKPEVCKVVDLAIFQHASYQKWGFGYSPAEKIKEQKNPLTWQALKTGSLKLNVDRLLSEGSTEGAVACVVRDSSGSLLDGFTKTVRAETVLQVETLGVLKALKYLKEKEIGEAVMESDNQVLANHLKREEQTDWQACGVLFECRVLLQQLPQVGLVCCPRSTNAVADWAARQQ
ncbi:hypothetical protein ACJRO7_024007 [Eucalyptus globulus]|uniref:RNase H type-1 domain-containing protein n=1 Tax=Eucalyptus globulus TaxID=34317 RepID=A0ABD3K676_EUCGL